ncbi:hypothetical protein [Sphingomonas sp. AX6]|uniref:hypothetical protein n=1 Tax=Sphingomonas sp. AX6 TaxID=2653171 RepID=UPI0012F14BC1|nr:hypothetical protein [Sphingomonas sp. AX6]VXC82809.1 conserved hypothetical protein [Sphingomonas sp. AX6]
MASTRPPFAIGRSGYRIAYYAHEINHCPGCGKSHWLMGRMTAECAYCSTALPLNEGAMVGNGLFRGKTGKIPAPLAA